MNPNNKQTTLEVVVVAVFLRCINITTYRYHKMLGLRTCCFTYTYHRIHALIRDKLVLGFGLSLAAPVPVGSNLSRNKV